jgi:hypothetical protein
MAAYTRLQEPEFTSEEKQGCCEVSAIRRHWLLRRRAASDYGRHGVDEPAAAAPVVCFRLAHHAFVFLGHAFLANCAALATGVSCRVDAFKFISEGRG